MPNKKTQQQKTKLIYQIELRGQLQDDWSDWFGGLSIRHDDTGNTQLTGDMVDQARLHGLLKRIRDAGMELISVNPITEADNE